MAGIKVPIYEVFKIGTDKLKYYNWDLTITKKEAFMLDELISLFEGQEFRLIAQILQRPMSSIDFSQYILSVVIDKKSEFKRATSRKGIKVNGITFRRFVGTTGGLKDNTLLFVNEEILPELNRRCECGRDKSVKLVPAKYEAYKALTCSASQEILSPEGILVVPDCITHFVDTVLTLDNTDPKLDSPTVNLEENIELENNVSDGYNLCTIDFMKKVAKKLRLNYVPSGVCLRNAWLKGMLYPFPIVEFVEKYNNGSYMVKDIWGHEHDIRNIEMILTESSLKLWNCYSSIDDYVKNYKECGYEFAVTKISPHILEDEREVNYQYLQSYEFTDEDIEQLCAPTVKRLKDSLCGDYEQTIKFLGISKDKSEFGWQKALATSEYMMNDPYIIDTVHRMIKKRIDEAKIGKLIVEGNYQIASGDAFALMQTVCGLEPTGLLKADECYSQYWADKGVDEVVIFRSPMTSHNNIRKCKVVDNEELRYWYQYMDTIMVINGFDTFCMAENGCDFDSDILFSTCNEILLKRHRKLPAINCLQSTSEKLEITEGAILKTNLNGMSNGVGKITNRISGMMEVIAGFPPDSEEYRELQYRIACGQQYQQDELDKIKGIIAKQMPSYWYNLKACGSDKFLQRVCVHRKPYFMTYVYASKRAEYNQYIKKNNRKCKIDFGCSIEELKAKEVLTEKEKDFLFWYERLCPVGLQECTMNKICFHIEREFANYVVNLKHNSEFDYTKLKVKRRCTEAHKEALKELNAAYTKKVSTFMQKSKNSGLSIEKNEKGNRDLMKKWFKEEAEKICPNDDERMNIMLDLCYGGSGNRMLCWDVVGDLIVKNLEEMENENNIE